MVNLAIVLVALSATVCAANTAVNVDLDTLTDFSATFTTDLKNVLAQIDRGAMLHRGPPPSLLGHLEGDQESGNLKVDVFNHRFYIDDVFDTRLKQGGSPVDKVLGKVQLAVDLAAGVVAFKGHASTSPLPARTEMCAKLSFPPQLAGMMLPPKRNIEFKAEMMKAKLDSAFAKKPHEDETIDGESIAVYGKHGPRASIYLGVRHNGAPFGVATVPPEHGTWDHILMKFPTWRKGAGEFPEISCDESTRATATDLLANEDTMWRLKMFDQVFESLSKNIQSVEGMEETWPDVPLRPSTIIEGLAAIEAMSSRNSEDQAMGVATIAGAVGFVAGLSVTMLKSFVKPYFHPGSERLLGDHA